MARKKKKINKDLVATGTQNLGYQGKVLVKINHGNKTISTKNYSNSGTPLLFKFFCTALMGSYTEALRPCKIKLFSFPLAEELGSDYNNPGNFDWYTSFSDTVNAPQGATPFITYDTTPKLKIKETSCEVTFHFRIPFSIISGSLIHMIGFYPNNTYRGAEMDTSAYYLLTNEKGDKWEPIELSDVTGNFSIIIEWTMAVMNKPKDNN